MRLGLQEIVTSVSLGYRIDGRHGVEFRIMLRRQC